MIIYHNIFFLKKQHKINYNENLYLTGRSEKSPYIKNPLPI